MISLVQIIATIVGGVAGYFIGKSFSKLGGYCPILCNPKISTIYFALLGFLLTNNK
ncbi:MAG: YtxH domain-containing protein [Ignavibacteria bacterium]|nr:YtxH domain-containing protein [Ignavibacteria bacterium]